jgi:N-acetylglutamate synthase-like GNAT family acetyltransferase
VSLPAAIIYSVDDSRGPDVEVVDQGLGDFNKQAAPIHTVETLSCFAKLSSGEVVGGAIGRTWGECCELKQLWVAEAYRHQGMGTRLVKLFEEHAHSRGCRTFFLETLSFQAPQFYRSLGYESRLEITGFPEGISKFIMVRELK